MFQHTKRYYPSGLHFLSTQSQQQKDWISYLQMLPFVNSSKTVKHVHFNTTFWRFWKWKPTSNKSHILYPKVYRFKDELKKSEEHLYSMKELR